MSERPDIDDIVTPDTGLARRRKTQPKNPLSIPNPKPVRTKDPNKVIYTPSVCNLARRVLYNEQGNLRYLAQILGVKVTEIYAWKKKHPEFKRACDEGVALSCDEIERSLRSVAVPHDEVTEEEGPDGVTTRTDKGVVNVKAAIAVLKAHKPEWKDKKGFESITGNTMTINLRLFGSAGEIASKQIASTIVAEQPETEDPDDEDDGSPEPE